MRKVFICLVIFFNSIDFFAQSDEIIVINHTVKAGETVRMISKKYLVSPSVIYQLNKFAVDGISQGMVLQIPSNETKKVGSQPVKSKQQDIQLADDVRVLDSIQQSISQQEVIHISEKSDADDASESAESAEQVIEHKVESKETLYAISRRYNVSVQDIQNQNEKLLAQGLKAGQVIRIKRNK